MKAIVLLSGGLDSAVSMHLAALEHQLELALTFDYGQRAADNEIKAAKKLAEDLNIKHQVIDLGFMADFAGELAEDTSSPIINPWVPNRNAIFINIAAGYAEYIQANIIVCGFNREEAADFPDNSADFTAAVNKCLYYSARNPVQVKSWTQAMNKDEIVQAALCLKLDLCSLWSCYQAGNKPCGSCSSCITNIKAFKKAGLDYNDYANIVAGTGIDL